MRRAWVAGLLAGLIGAAGCLVDDAALCGADLVKGPTGACICPADQVLQAGECHACGNHARAVSGSCVCDRGYAIAAAGTECVKSTTPSAGDDLDAASNVIPLDAATLAAEAQAANPTDESAVCGAEDCAPCSSSADCEPGELCDRFGQQHCVPAPIGLGMPCSAAADCAQTSATYCELFSSRTCQIQGCKELSGVCPGDLVCCDYAILGTSLCIPSSEAPDGQCPAPGSAVPRESTP